MLRDCLGGGVVKDEQWRENPARKVEIMKNSNKMLLVVFAAFTVTLAGRAVASDEPVLSPRAKQMQETFRRAPGTTEDKLDRSVKPMSPRAQQMAETFHRVPITSNGIDLAHPKDVVIMGKHNITNSQFRVAPLK